MQITLRPKKVTGIFVTVLAFLLVMNGVTLLFRFYYGHPHVQGFVPLFDMNGEGNVPAWFSSFLFIWCAFLALFIGFARKQRNLVFAGHWRALGVILLLLSADETASLHEKMSYFMEKIYHFSGFFYHAWTILGIAFVLILAVFYLPVFLSLPRKIKNLAFSAAFIYVIGAVGAEMLQGHHNQLYGNASLGYYLIGTVEELLEFTGLILFSHTLTLYCKSESRIPLTR